jgi:hypothetical protein
MSTYISIVVTRPDMVPMIKASGDIGAFLEILPEQDPGDPFFVATSDGTLLRGSAGDGFRLEMAGTADARIEGMMATFDSPIDWISVGRTWADHPTRYTAAQTARDRETAV